MKSFFSANNAKPPGYVGGKPAALNRSAIDIESINGRPLGRVEPNMQRVQSDDITMQRVQSDDITMQRVQSDDTTMVRVQSDDTTMVRVQSDDTTMVRAQNQEPTMQHQDTAVFPAIAKYKCPKLVEGLKR